MPKPGRHQDYPPYGVVPLRALDVICAWGVVGLVLVGLLAAP